MLQNILNNFTTTKIYNADFIVGSLLIPESRRIAQLLLNNIDEDTWHKEIRVENILQKKSKIMARQQSKLIRNRLSLMTPQLWHFVAEGSYELVIQSLFAASIKYNHLIGDFLLRVVKEHIQMFNNKLSINDWLNFLIECEQIEPKISQWTNNTRKKLSYMLFRTLAEAKYIDNVQNKVIVPVYINSDLRKYLIFNHEQYVLSCMEIYQ